MRPGGGFNKAFAFIDPVRQFRGRDEVIECHITAGRHRGVNNGNMKTLQKVRPRHEDRRYLKVAPNNERLPADITALRVSCMIPIFRSERPSPQTT